MLFTTVLFYCQIPLYSIVIFILMVVLVLYRGKKTVLLEIHGGQNIVLSKMA